MKHFSSLLLVATATVALAGCFGGGDDPVVVPADPLAAVPDSAVQSVAGTLEYLALLIKNPSETREPIDISAVVLPISDTTEPAAVE